jgi:hypothetical protein
MMFEKLAEASVASVDGAIFKSQKKGKAGSHMFVSCQ